MTAPLSAPSPSTGLLLIVPMAAALMGAYQYFRLHREAYAGNIPSEASAHRSQGRVQRPVPLRLREEIQEVLRRGDGELSAVCLLVPVVGYFDFLSKKHSQVTKKKTLLLQTIPSLTIQGEASWPQREYQLLSCNGRSSQLSRELVHHKANSRRSSSSKSPTALVLTETQFYLPHTRSRRRNWRLSQQPGAILFLRISQEGVFQQPIY